MTELTTNAEKHALQASELSGFKNLALPGIKDKVAETLSMIGSVEGIFSTYTKHDISHINTMLNMLDWVIHPSTQKAMTPLDWLMTVLSIYFHDLGMVVTSAEYEQREQNEEFNSFRNYVLNDPDAKDYVARAENMGDDEKERFYYQEFVRNRHALRIREWITDRHAWHWGESLKPITDEINKIMEQLPSRFRENLATVCESHHKDNLNDLNAYPLYEMYGNDEKETVNVQYAALILRTVDLIHVTKDRTPSMMYKTIAFSDLKGVDEWDKQRGTFAVRGPNREFDVDDKNSHFIQVKADFTEERPYFALSEYLAWADREIKKTKQWADESQLLPNGKNFIFPWHSLKGDVRVEGNAPRQMRFELDRGRLLDLLVGHTIYNDATVAVRELLQNSIDAVRYQHHLDKKEAIEKKSAELAMGKVQIEWDSVGRELTIEDNGIGMDLAVIENHLLKVGSSFYESPQFQSESASFTPISRFGIGVLTCFMISDDVEIITCRNGEGRRIRMTSVHADYLLKDLSSGAKELQGLEPHGTRVKLRLRPSVNLENVSILDIVKHWIILPACNVVYVEDNKETPVGFNNVKDALEDLYFKSKSSPNKEDRNREVIVTNPVESDGSYELAFVVKRGFTPEQAFVSEHGAAVCIEGIRVDSRLPGWASNFSGLLSVRNNRKFRTTVSRANLEQDDEYLRVAQICAEALFSHVKGEVERISNQLGHPLSQASAAGRWTYQSLTSGVEPKQVKPYLKELYENLPLVVVEKSQNLPDDSTNKRLLSTLQDISIWPHFWTIESRTVDNLGIISKDLGRELGVSDFLGKLAPELLDSRITPVIVDAHQFNNELRESHAVEEVEFSRQHQQTLTKWKAVSKGGKIHISSAVSLELEEIGKKLGVSIRHTELSDMIRVTENVLIGQISGDIPDVHGVTTRMCNILKEGSVVSQCWQTLYEVWQKVISLEANSVDIARIIAIRWLFAVACDPRGSSRLGRGYYDPDIEGVKVVVSAWRDLLPEIIMMLESLKIDAVIPERLEDVIGSKKNWFNASDYWRDWERFDR